MGIFIEKELEMKNSYFLIAVYIFIFFFLAGLSIFSIDSAYARFGEVDPPAEPAPQPTAKPIDGTGPTADQQMRELKGYVAPIENIENKTMEAEAALSETEEAQIAPAAQEKPAVIEKTAPAAKEAPEAIEKLRALEDSSL
jgi:hypothetical protein